MGFNDFFGGMFDIDGDGKASSAEGMLGFLVFNEVMKDDDEDTDKDDLFFDLDDE